MKSKCHPVPIAGVDLGKRRFHVVLTDESGTKVSKHHLSRDDFLLFFSSLTPMTVAMESCMGAHHWASELAARSHHPLLLTPRFVSKLRTGHKNDANDAGLIAMAARHPAAKPVPRKTPEQLAVLSLHRVRDLLRQQKVTASNHLLALLVEMGDVTFRNMDSLLRADEPTFGAVLSRLSPTACVPLTTALENLKHLRLQERSVDRALQQWHASSSLSQSAASVPGIGYLTASALAAIFGDGSAMSGRQFAASLGLVPIQHSTGGVPRLGKIGRGGDHYMRRLLLTAGLSAALLAHREGHGPACLVELLYRKPMRVALCAHANRLARTTWAILSTGGQFNRTKQWREIDFYPPGKKRSASLHAEEVE